MHKLCTCYVRPFWANAVRNSVGHPLCAWLRYFDSGLDGDGQCSLEDFVAAMRRLSFLGEAEALFKKIDVDGSGFLTLYEVDSKCADLWAAFRAWCAESFGSEEDMASRWLGFCTKFH